MALVAGAVAFGSSSANAQELGYGSYGGGGGGYGYGGDRGGLGGGYGGFNPYRAHGDFYEDPSTYSLTVGGGVASPSSMAFFGENPAGLVYNVGANMLGYLATDQQYPNLLSNGLSFMAGNGLAAASIGVQSFNNASDSGGAITRANFGVATFVDRLNVAVGLNGSYRFTAPGDSIDPALSPTWAADAGLLFNPYGPIRFGFTAYNLDQGVTALGAGISAHVNSVSVLSLDASTDNHGQGLTVKPGIGVHAGAMNLTYAYGMQANKNGTSGISTGNTIGLGYCFNPQFSLLGYYNQFSTFFLGAQIGLF